MPSSASPRTRTAPRRPHPYSLLTQVLEVGRAMLLPAVVGGASMGGHRMGRMMLWGLIFLAVPTLLFAVAEYLALRYHVAGDELILDSGVFSRRHRVIPLARVQNLDLRQNALQRLLDVAELRVETAGGDADEPVPLVLGRQEAEALRTELLAGRERAAARAEAASAPAAEVLAHVSPRELALAGATANEAGVIFALLIAALEVAYQFPLGLPRVRLDPRVLIPDLPLTSAVLLGLAILLLFAILAWLLSIAGAMVRYWDFVLERAGRELRKRYGSLDRREVTIPLARVQALRVEESLMRRPLGFASLKIETAGGGPGDARGARAEAFLPLTRVRGVPRLVAAVFDDFEYGGLDFHPVHSYAGRRAFLRYSLPVLILAAGLAVWLGPVALWLLALLPFAAFAARIHYHHLGYALAPGYLVARSGFFNRVTWVVPEHRIQTLHLVETPFQRRWQVASVVVDTAAGQVGIPDLGCDEARTLLERLADRLEGHPAAAEGATRAVNRSGGAEDPEGAPPRGRGSARNVDRTL
jgi:putative membrane protein